MKAFCRWFAGLSLAMVATVIAGAFEGRVSLAIKSGREKEQVIDYAIKDGAVRMEPKGADGGTAMIMDWAKQEMIILMPEQRMFMVMPLKSGTPAAVAAAEGPEPKVEKTGRTETILGYVCEQYITIDKDSVTEMWITEELGSFAGLGGGMGGNPMGGMMGGRNAKSPAASSWERALQGKAGAFPLRIVGRDGRGRETFRLEARKIEPGQLPATLFAPPADFQKFSMPAMPGMGG